MTSLFGGEGRRTLSAFPCCSREISFAPFYLLNYIETRYFLVGGTSALFPLERKKGNTALPVN